MSLSQCPYHSDPTKHEKKGGKDRTVLKQRQYHCKLTEHEIWREEDLASNTNAHTTLNL